MIVRTQSVYLPSIAGWLLALHVDRCKGGFSSVGGWRDCWPGAGGCPVRTLGVDLGPVRVRVVIERELESHGQRVFQSAADDRL